MMSPTLPLARDLADSCRQGQLSRREFLTRATALGVSGSVAYGLLGLTAPARAQTPPTRGGAIRVQMPLPPLRDPRLADWPTLANLYRSWLENLVDYQADGTLRGRLLVGWDLTADARHYRLHLRPDVKWSNGDAFVAAHVAHNFARWCDSLTNGNSMAARMSALIDPTHGQLAEGVVKVIDDLTLELTLRKADATLMATLSDYPAAVVHPSFDPAQPVTEWIGTGPYRPALYIEGDSARLIRDDAHWWNRGQGAWLDQIDYVDYGTSPARTLEAARSGAIDMTHSASIEHLVDYETLGWTRHEVQTASTLVVRFKQSHPPFDRAEVRRAIIAAVDNAIVLEIGHHSAGLVGANDHACPIQPDTAPLLPAPFDRAAARDAIRALGLGEQVFELMSLDDDWQATSCDAIAVQCRDAGLQVTRKLLPAADYWRQWRDHPWAATEWSMRPLAVQAMTLGYRSGSQWNESHFADPAFDAELDIALGTVRDVDRQVSMAKLQTRLRAAGVMIQPFWRKLYRTTAPQWQGTDPHPMQVHDHTLWWRMPQP